MQKVINEIVKVFIFWFIYDLLHIYKIILLIISPSNFKKHCRIDIDLKFYWIFFFSLYIKA